jgi:hypothetical protein
LNKVVSAGIAEALRDGNTGLRQVEGLWYESCTQEINDMLVVLNRYRRNMVASRGAAVPLERWGDVLMRISNADCSYFVTERVRAALSGPGPLLETRIRRAGRVVLFCVRA